LPLPRQARLPGSVPIQGKPAVRPPNAPELSLVVELNLGRPGDLQPPNLLQVNAVRMESMTGTVWCEGNCDFTHITSYCCCRFRFLSSLRCCTRSLKSSLFKKAITSDS
jgi:hypothetical protein